MQPVKTSLLVLSGLLFLPGCASTQDATANDILENKLPGTAMLTGEVTAPKAFQAAKVYARNTDKNIIYMVYTGGGRYQTVALFPGPYEVWVEKTGFESDRQEIQVEVGDVLNVDFSLREATPRSAGQGSFLGRNMGDRTKEALLLPYDELYPEAPIRSLMENTCIQCHGQSFIPFRHHNTEEWDEVIGTMLVNRIPPGTISSAQRKELKESGKVVQAPIKEAFRDFRREILTAIGVNWLNATVFYTVWVYNTTYLATVIGLPLSSALLINTLSMLFLIIAIPIMGALSDRVGRKPLLISGCVGVACLAYPLYYLLSQGSFGSALIAQLVFVIPISMLQGTMPTTMVELFPTSSRYSALSISYNIAFAIFGGTAPLVATQLISMTGNPLSPSYWLIVGAVVSLLVTLSMKERYREPLR